MPDGFEGVQIAMVGDDYLHILLFVFLGLVFLWGFLSNRRLSIKRAQAMAILRKRADVDPEQAWFRLAAASGIEADHVRRIWFALAKEYGIPAGKLRIDDRFDGELAGLFGHPDHDPFLTSLFIGSRRAVEKHPVKPQTWGDLVVVVRRIELAAGRLATVASGGEQGFAWAD